MQEFALTLSKEVNDQVELRLGRALTVLVRTLARAYDQQFTLKGGNAAAAITYEMKRTGKVLEAVIGPGESAKYLAYLEFGERGTQGMRGAPALYSRTKAPPIRNIYQWIVRAGVATPQSARDRAEANARRAQSTRKHPKFDQKREAPWYSIEPAIVFAFMIAMKRKKFGRPGLRVLERVVQEQTAKLEQYLNQ